MIELVVTVAVIAIVAGIAMPPMRDLIQRNQVAAEVNRLLSDLLFARNTAITRGRVVTLCRSSDQVACLSGSTTGQFEKGWMTYMAPAARTSLAASAGFELLKVGETAGSDLEIRTVGAQGPDFISFLPSGRIDPAAPGSIVINVCHGGVSTALVPGKRLTLSVSGRPSLTEIAPGSC